MTSRLIWVGSQAEHDRPPRGVYIGVPAVVHRVVVTSAATSSEEVNPFENAVLGLVAAGVGGSPEIAEYLGIDDTKFIDHIIERLAEDHHVGKSGRRWVLTDQGQGILEQRHAVLDQESWFVLQDATTGQLWSRAVNQFTPVDAVTEGSRRTAELGTQGTPRPTPYWELRWPSQAQVLPTSADVRAAVQRHLQSMHAARRAIDGPDFDHLPKPARHTRSSDVDVKLIPGVEEQVRVLVRVSHRAPEIDSSIMIHDPFGLVHLPALEYSILNEIESVDALAAYVDRGLDHLRTNSSRSLAPRWEPEAREKIAVALRVAIDQNAPPTFAGVAGLDSELALVRLTRLGFDVPKRLPPLSPGAISAVAAGAAGLLHELLIAWIEGCPDDVARSIAERSPNLVQVVLALADDSDGSVDHQTAVEAIATIEHANDNAAVPAAERSNETHV
jgi:hypothetical protein